MTVTFEDIVKANAEITTTAIKGKDYAEVNQRVKAFRMVYPTGRITTQMLSNENGVCVFYASVGFTDCVTGEYLHLGSGTAYEKEESSFINKTSYIENCETSAVGRALGFAGFGIDTSIASADEVGNAIKNQTDEKKDRKKSPYTVSEAQKTELELLLKEAGIDVNEVCRKVKIESLSELTVARYKAYKQKAESMIKEKNDEKD